MTCPANAERDAVTTKRTIHGTLARLAAAEDAFLQSEFLAPVLRGQGVQVRIAGVRCQLRVEPADFHGWGVFRPLSHTQARFVRLASMAQRRQYLGLFPAVAMILCARQGGSDAWLALPAAPGDAPLASQGMVPVWLVDEAELFDTAWAAFEGSRLWFDQVDSRSDPRAAVYLRESVNRMTEPARLDRPGLTAGQREAYAAVYEYRLRRSKEDARTAGERRLREALTHAGAEFRDFAERGDVYTVTYTVDGRRHTSAVRKSDLSVQTAGICLSGQDQKFDLHSLVGVLREGRGAGRVR